MKYLLIQTKPDSEFQNWLFPIDDSRKLSRLYRKLKMLFLRDLPCEGNFYRVSNLPQTIFTEWEWEIVSKMENFRLANMVVMTQWEYDLIRVIDVLGMRMEVRKSLQRYINQKNKQILQDVRIH